MDGTRYYLQYKTDYINFDTQSLTLYFSPCSSHMQLRNKCEKKNEKKRISKDKIRNLEYTPKITAK